MPAIWKVSYRPVAADGTKCQIIQRNVIASNIIEAINKAVIAEKEGLSNDYDIIVFAAEVIAWEGTADG